MAAPNPATDDLQRHKIQEQIDKLTQKFQQSQQKLMETYNTKLQALQQKLQQVGMRRG